MGATVYDKEAQKQKPDCLKDALTYLNEFLAYDGYEIVPHGRGYDVVDRTRGEIVVDVKLEPSHLSHDFPGIQARPLGRRLAGPRQFASARPDCPMDLVRRTTSVFLTSARGL